ncbi:MAG: phosphonoacetaldehyde hydrolase [Pirellulaceae bacterium]
MDPGRIPFPAHPLQAVILDWAGTTVDFGSRAPTKVFIEIFRQRGVKITAAEARGPMGRAKRDHIAAVAAVPRVSEAWTKKHGKPPVDADIQAMYDDFLPLQKETLSGDSDVIPGVAEAIDECRRMGLAIGSTTGYTRELMEVVAPIAAAGGYAPDVLICSDDVSAGRPAPWMNLHAAERLGVFPLSSIVVVDDTPVGITAGLNAGCWTVAVSETGNALGLSAQEVAELDEQQRAGRLAEIGRGFLEIGAHFVIRGVRELPELLRRINTLITGAAA